MDTRLELVRFVEEGSSISDAARQFGVSRKTAHKWLERFEAQGAVGLSDLSRRPHSSPSALRNAVIERILSLKVAFPTWGPRKLRDWLLLHESTTPWPAASTIGALLKEIVEETFCKKGPDKMAVICSSLGDFRSQQKSNDSHEEFRGLPGRAASGG